MMAWYDRKSGQSIGDLSKRQVTCKEKEMIYMEDKLKRIAEHPELSWFCDEKNTGIFIQNTEFDTKIFATWKALEDNNFETIYAQTVQGKATVGITRVTGYMSTTDNWNKGKLAELKDRHRYFIG